VEKKKKCAYSMDTWEKHETKEDKKKNGGTQHLGVSRYDRAEDVLFGTHDNIIIKRTGECQDESGQRKANLENSRKDSEVHRTTRVIKNSAQRQGVVS